MFVRDLKQINEVVNGPDTRFPTPLVRSLLLFRATVGK